MRRIGTLVLSLIMFLRGLVIAAPLGTPSPRPGSDEAAQHCRSGQREFSSARWKEAAAELEQAVRLNPQLMQCHYLLGLCYYQLGAYDKAENEFTTVTILDGHSYQAYVQLAAARMAQGQFERAKEAARGILKFDQRSFLAYYTLGVIAYKQGVLKESLDQFDHSRALWEEYAPTQYNLGVTLYNSGQTGPALARLRKACLLEERKPLYLFVMGWMQFMAHDKGLANNTFRRLLDEDNTKVYSTTAKALMEMSAGTYAEARKDVDAALKIDAEMVKALVLKGLLLTHDGKKDEAVAVLQEALEIDPLDFDARDTLTHLGVTPPAPKPARLPGQHAAPHPSTTAPSPTPASPPSPTPASGPEKNRPPMPPPPGAPAPR